MKFFKKQPKETKNSKKNANDQGIKPLTRWRFITVCGFVGLSLFALVARAAYIQVINPGKLIHQGNLRTLREEIIPATRGIIYSRNGDPLAISVPVDDVWIDPYQILKLDSLQKTDRWEALAKVLNLNLADIVNKINNNKSRQFMYIARQVTPAIGKYIDELNIDGVGLKAGSRRFYPTGEINAQLVGITGIDGKGLSGIEATYNNWLSGTPGKMIVRKDRDGQVVENIAIQKPVLGHPLTLSINEKIQSEAYKLVKQAVLDFDATSATIVMVDVKTGEVLAMATAPSFNPNDRSHMNFADMRNRAIADAYEPGSTMKPFVVMAGLANGVIGPHTKINTGNGRLLLNGSWVRDDVPIGDASVDKILRYSSNVGASHISLAMPIRMLLNEYSKVGLSSPSGINLIGATTGYFPERRRWSNFERATVAFGYGISVTPMQLVHAYATLGDMGVYHPLTILKTDKPTPGIRVNSIKNARTVVNMLETIVHPGGTAVRAAVPGYRVGAKTGTAKIADVGGYGNGYMGWTAGVAPISNPRIATVVLVNNPQSENFYGGFVAAPLWSKVVGTALQVLNVPPDANTIYQNPYIYPHGKPKKDGSDDNAKS